MNWTLFTTMLAQVDPLLQSAVTQIYSALITYVGPAFRTGLIAWIAGHALARMLVTTDEPISNLLQQALKAALVYTIILTQTNYGAWAQDVILNGLSQEIGTIIAGAIGAEAADANAFDRLLGTAFVGGLAVLKNVPWHAFALQLIIAIYLIVALAATAVCFVVWCIPHILLSIVVATGPLFGVLLVFPLFARLFYGWLSVALGCVVLQVFVVVLLAVLLAAENTLITQINATTGGAFDARNEMNQILQLLGGIALFLISAAIGRQLPGAAATIASGSYVYTDQTVRQVMAALAAPASAAGRAAARLDRAVQGARSGTGGSIASQVAPHPGLSPVTEAIHITRP